MNKRKHSPDYYQITPRWFKFADFWEDVKKYYGEKLVLARIDDNIPYSKDNVIWRKPWAESKIARRIRFQGKIQTIGEIAYEIGICPQTIYKRLKHLTTSEVFQQGKRNGNCKPIELYTTDNKLIGRWFSAREAGKVLNIHPKRICEYLKGHKVPAGNRIFQYEKVGGSTSQDFI